MSDGCVRFGKSFLRCTGQNHFWLLRKVFQK